MIINHFLENSAQKFPDKQAIWHENEWITYIEIETLANKLANYLKSISICRGDRVALLHENSFDYVISYFAILKAGAVAVLLNTETTTDALIFLLNNSESKAIITNREYSDILAPAIKKIPDLKHVIVQQDDLSVYEEIGHCSQTRLNDIYDNGYDSHPGIRCIDIDLACIIYTSGSSGEPKGVALSHLNIVSNTHSIVQYLDLTSQDRIMVILPFYYIYGMSLLHTHFSVGGSMVLDNRFVFPQVILDTMKKTDVTGFAGVPSTFFILLNKSAIRNYKFDSLRYVTQAGSAMAPDIQEEVAKVFDPAKLFIMYGATEASPRLAYLEPEKHSQKLGSAGKAVPNVDLFVVDENGLKLPPNQTGHIVARGSNIMTGYWKNPVATSKVLKNGLYYTGDLGTIDEDGYIYIAGRAWDFIKTGGRKTSAQEIERDILQINEVRQVAVTSVKDPVLGEAICAHIVPSENTPAAEEKIKNEVKKLLPRYKQPKYFAFIDSLPMNEAGKIMKSKLNPININLET